MISTQKTKRRSAALRFKGSVTHAVCVGMTGSGKTGLASLCSKKPPSTAFPRSSSIRKAICVICADVSRPRAGRLRALGQRRRRAEEKSFRQRLCRATGRPMERRTRRVGDRTASASNACGTPQTFASTRPAAMPAFRYRFSNRLPLRRKRSGRTTNYLPNGSTRQLRVCSADRHRGRSDPSREHILLSNILNQNGRPEEISTRRA